MHSKSAPGGGAKLAPAESLQSRGHAGRGVLPNSGTPSPRILSTIKSAASSPQSVTSPAAANSRQFGRAHGGRSDQALSHEGPRRTASARAIFGDGNTAPGSGHRRIRRAASNFLTAARRPRRLCRRCRGAGLHRRRALSGPAVAALAEHPERVFTSQVAWTAHLDRLGISALEVNPDPVMVATEGALWGSVKAHGFLPDTVIVSDDAGQFNVGPHGLCWVHAERLVHKLDTFTDEQREAQRRMRALIWRFYRDLKTYRQHPTRQRKAALRARFDRIFTRKTGFVTLDRLLARLHANKHELLMVLDRPEIPLHTNGSENDVRCQVTKRKISGGTRSDTGRDCRDAFLGLSKTCAKLGITFWEYLGSRLAVPNHTEIPYLPTIVRHRCATA